MSFVHCGRREFIDRIREKRLVLYGASRQLEEAMIELTKWLPEIRSRVIAVFDGDSEKWGNEVKLSEEQSHIIKSPNWLVNELFQEQNPEEIAVLITSRFYYDIAVFLKKELENQAIDIPVFAYACLILDEENTDQNKFKMRVLDQAISLYQEYLDSGHFSEKEKKEKYDKLRCELTQKKDPHIIPSVVLLHSNICTLKCENCCDLIPEVEKPYYRDAQTVFREFQLLLSGVECCIRADLTDGEPFLYKDLAELLALLIEENKVKTIFMFTNATVIPDEKILKLLQHEKCFLHVSDYGLKDKIYDFSKVLDQWDIKYKVLKEMKWQNFKKDGLKRRKEGKEWLDYDFLRCGNKKCSKPLIQNRLYGCMPAFRYANVGIFSSEKDYVILKETDVPEQIWEKIYGICMIDFIETCRYCHFGDVGLEYIEAGKQ